ncbi:MAG: zinc ribbon domain-containing protein [Planctomycetota bacterium]
MPTYVYETVPQDEKEPPVQFELFQRMSDDPLTEHPETGQPVRRLISGGLLPPVASKSGGGCCGSGSGPGCGCG